MATIYYTATTLDGFLATPEHSLDWLFEVEHDPGVQESMDAFIATVGAQVMGSSTYEWLLREDDLVDHPETWEEFAGGRPSWVFTHRELPVVPGADVRFTREPVERVHAEAVAAAGDRDVWLMGGGDLVGQFADVGLLDRVIATIAPVTLGGGAPLLPRDLRSDRLTLVSATQRGAFAELVYDVASPA